MLKQAIDRWSCYRCPYVYEGACRPHESFGWTVEEVGHHQWTAHKSTKDTSQDGKWEHLTRRKYARRRNNR